VKARTKFMVSGLLVLGSAGFLMASSIRDTAVYYLTPSELAAKVRTDPTFYETGVKIGARVVPGTIQRAEGGREVSFTMTDGTREYPVNYKGIIPDTFSDSADVVLEGRLGKDGTFRATVLLAKCASRYENAPDKPGYESGAYGKHPEGVPKTSTPAAGGRS